MNIRINKATDPGAWYAQHVGQVLVVERAEINLRPDQGIPEDVYWCREGGTYNPINWVRKSDATEVPTYPYNPAHPIGTCTTCGGEMVYNVPRLGPDGGFVHKATGYLLCGPRPELKVTGPMPKPVASYQSTKLSQHQLDLVYLYLRSPKDSEGWAKVSAFVWSLMKDLPRGLFDIEAIEGGGGRIRANEIGATVIPYL